MKIKKKSLLYFTVLSVFYSLIFNNKQIFIFMIKKNSKKTARFTKAFIQELYNDIHILLYYLNIFNLEKQLCIRHSLCMLDCRL